MPAKENNNTEKLKLRLEFFLNKLINIEIFINSEFVIRLRIDRTTEKTPTAVTIYISKYRTKV